MTLSGRLPLVEDDLRWNKKWWKTTFGGTTFGGRRPSAENDLCWKTTFCGRQLSVEDNLRWKTTFGGRFPLVEDYLQWTTAFDGRQPSVEDNLQLKITFGGRRPLVLTPPLDSHSKTEPKLELLSDFSTGNRLCHCRKMCVAFCRQERAHFQTKTTKPL